MNRWIIVAASVSAIAAASCASATGGARPANCDAAPGDSAFAAAGPVYHACAVDKKAVPVNRLSIEFQPETMGTACYSAEVEFVVATTGTPELGTARIVRSNNHIFADAVLGSLPHWRYAPATRNGRAVRQIVTLTEILVGVRRGSDLPSPPAC